MIYDYNNGYMPQNNGYYPQYYQPQQYYQQSQPQPQPQPQAQQSQGQPKQTQQTSFVSVRSIDEAKNYPIAPGNSITFIDETRPFVYVKSKGNSGFDLADFKIYELVEQKEQQTIDTHSNKSQFVTFAELNPIFEEINALKTEISGLKATKTTTKKTTKETESEAK